MFCFFRVTGNFRGQNPDISITDHAQQPQQNDLLLPQVRILKGNLDSSERVELNNLAVSIKSESMGENISELKQLHKSTNSLHIELQHTLGIIWPNLIFGCLYSQINTRFN